MNIRPMDMQVLIPRATEVAKSQQSNEQQNTLQQQQFADKLEKLADNRQKQVQSSPKNEGGKVKAKTEQENQHKQKKEEESDQPKEVKAVENVEKTGNHPSIEDPLRGHRVDIKL
jgi:hypothetical protein